MSIALREKNIVQLHCTVGEGRLCVDRGTSIKSPFGRHKITASGVVHKRVTKEASVFHVHHRGARGVMH